jgi:hypothetical protein
MCAAVIEARGSTLKALPLDMPRRCSSRYLRRRIFFVANFLSALIREK